MPADYFTSDGRNEETEKIRAGVKKSLEEQIIRYFQKEGGQVAIYDANVGYYCPASEYKLSEEYRTARSKLEKNYELLLSLSASTCSL